MADSEQQTRVPNEEEPLLGEPGDAVQYDKPLYHNLIVGSGVIAQFGAWIIAAIVWGAVFSNDLIFFSAHPLVNSTALVFAIQGMLILQPTQTANQKKQGTYAHAALNDVALSLAIAGLVIIEINKADHGGHFESPHAILGLTTYILIFLQGIVGATQYFFPGIYGGVEQAKAIYKYHRVGGYITLLMMLATVCAATKTTYNKDVLGIQLWAVVVAAVLVVLGAGARIRMNKFGWLAGR